MSTASVQAPGSGQFLAPTWCSSDKDFVTTSLGRSRLWATIGHGVINEVYWPSTGEPELRDVTFYLVGKDGWIDLKRVRTYRLSVESPAVPVLTIVHEGEDYRVTLEPLPDPRRDVLLVRFTVEGEYQLVVIAAPHLGGSGHDNVAVVHEDGLVATQGHDRAVTLRADVPLIHRSVGVVGVSDGWQDLDQHGTLTWSYEAAGPGNVALTASTEARRGVLALGFATSTVGARTLARSSLAEGFDLARRDFVTRWRAWERDLHVDHFDERWRALAMTSAAVLKMHEDRTYPGAIAASLSVPWGNTTTVAGGYHLVWPRDAGLTALALVAAGQIDDARHVLARFVATQLPDGHWAQNEYPDGTVYWHGQQLDEVAFPVVLAAKLAEVTGTTVYGVPAMVRSALGCLARMGPSTHQDRWEENPGINPFTVAVMIAALVAGGRWLTAAERAEALVLADEWNERIETWCYATDTPLARRFGVPGHYVRLSVPSEGGLDGEVMLRNRDGEMIAAADLVALEFSYLVRFGLRRADDPRVVDTLTVVDAVLGVPTPAGVVYRRYVNDGYGERADGSAFSGSGVGRLWPLLTGERGHLAVLAGQDATPYLRTMQQCASAGGMLPEQVWDTDPIPERELYPGSASGSAMPLVWAHAEFIKLAFAALNKRCVEQLDAVEARYATARPASRWSWRDDTPFDVLPAGRDLLVEARQPFTVHLGFDGWEELHEVDALPLPFGRWGVLVEAATLAGHRDVTFTRRTGEHWEGVDHRVTISAG